MSRSTNIIVLILTVMVLALSGCLESSEGSRDEKLISRSLARAKRAYERQDVSAIIAENSKDYQGQYGEDIDVLREFLEDFKESGWYCVPVIVREITDEQD